MVLGIQCGAVAMNYVIHVVNVTAELELNTPVLGEVRRHPSPPRPILAAPSRHSRQTSSARNPLLPPPVSLPPTHPPQSCPGEWVYHFIDTASIGGDGRHYGSGHHLMYTLTKRYGSGSSSAVTRHVAAPIKVVPPYVTIGSDTAYGENVTITM